MVLEGEAEDGEVEGLTEPRLCIKGSKIDDRRSYFTKFSIPMPNKQTCSDGILPRRRTQSHRFPTWPSISVSGHQAHPHREMVSRSSSLN